MLSRRSAAVFMLSALALPIASCGNGGNAMDERTVLPDSSGLSSAVKERTGSQLELISARHIFIPFRAASTDSAPDGPEGRDALDRITEIGDMIASGEESFEALAYRYSECPSAVDSGRLPAFTRGTLARSLDSAAAALAPGEISGVLRTRSGYHILKRTGP